MNRRANSQPLYIAPCPGCGNPPGGAVRVGKGMFSFWLECRPCGRRTADGQGFELALEEWNGGVPQAVSRPTS